MNKDVTICFKMEITIAERSSKGSSGKDGKGGGVKMYEVMDVGERREYVNGIMGLRLTSSHSSIFYQIKKTRKI